MRAESIKEKHEALAEIAEALERQAYYIESFKKDKEKRDKSYMTKDFQDSHKLLILERFERILKHRYNRIFSTLQKQKI